LFSLFHLSLLILVLDDDDVELLDLIARNGGDLNKPRPITGSQNKEPTSNDYSLSGRNLKLILLFECKHCTHLLLA